MGLCSIHYSTLDLKASKAFGLICKSTHAIKSYMQASLPEQPPASTRSYQEAEAHLSPWHCDLTSAMLCWKTWPGSIITTPSILHPRLRTIGLAQSPHYCNGLCTNTVHGRQARGACWMSSKLAPKSSFQPAGFARQIISTLAAQPSFSRSKCSRD